LIVGGNAFGFQAAAKAFSEATTAGIGVSRVLLPDSLQKTVGKVFEAGEYGPSTPSGSFSKGALATLLDMSLWSDAVLLAGDFGRNSETAILLEDYIDKYKDKLIITQDGLDYFTKLPKKIIEREETLLVCSFSQLQKMATGVGFRPAFTFKIDMLNLIELLHNFTQKYAAKIIVKHLDNIFVADNGRISSTKCSSDNKIWRVKVASHASTWWLQNPNKSFEALNSSLINLK
jgi:hypothetical protein